MNKELEKELIQLVKDYPNTEHTLPSAHREYLKLNEKIDEYVESINNEFGKVDVFLAIGFILSEECETISDALQMIKEEKEERNE